MNFKLIDIVPEFIGNFFKHLANTNILKVGLYTYILKHLAGTCFLPAGLYIGYIFHIYEFTDPKGLSAAKFGPYIVSMVAAVVTAIFFTLIRYFRRREVFYHLYCQTVGCILFFIGGVILWGAHDGKYKTKYRHTEFNIPILQSRTI